MEGKEILQLEELESYIECNICTQTLKEPIVTNCGHEFCKSCIEKCMRKKENCPICRKEIIMIIRVPKLDLLVHGYEYLLGKEKEYIRMKEKFEEQKRKIDDLTELSDVISKNFVKFNDTLGSLSNHVSFINNESKCCVFPVKLVFVFGFYSYENIIFLYYKCNSDERLNFY